MGASHVQACFDGFFYYSSFYVYSEEEFGFV